MSVVPTCFQTCARRSGWLDSVRTLSSSFLLVFSFREMLADQSSVALAGLRPGSGSAEVASLGSEAPTVLSPRIFCMERFGGLRPAFERWRAQSCMGDCLKGFL